MMVEEDVAGNNQYKLYAFYPIETNAMASSAHTCLTNDF